MEVALHNMYLILPPSPGARKLIRGMAKTLVLLVSTPAMDIPLVAPTDTVPGNTIVLNTMFRLLWCHQTYIPNTRAHTRGREEILGQTGVTKASAFHLNRSIKESKK